MSLKLRSQTFFVRKIRGPTYLPGPNNMYRPASRITRKYTATGWKLPWRMTPIVIRNSDPTITAKHNHRV